MKAYLIIFVLLISGCASNPSNTNHSDYTWTDSVSSHSYQASYRNIKEAAEKCESSWHLDSNLYTDINEGRINVYLKNLIFQNPQFLLAKVTITKTDKGSLLSIGTIDSMDKNFAIERNTAKKLISWANGNLNCQ